MTLTQWMNPLTYVMEQERVKMRPLLHRDVLM